MRRFLLPGSVVVAAVALLALLVFGVAGQGTDSSIDAALAHGRRPPVPHATQPLPVLASSGGRSLAELRGKVVVLNVFASWCGPCVAEAGGLERAEHRISSGNPQILRLTY